MKYLVPFILFYAQIFSDDLSDAFNELYAIDYKLPPKAIIQSTDKDGNNELQRLQHVLNRLKLALLTYKPDDLILENYPSAHIFTTSTYKIKFVSIIDKELGKRYFMIRGNSNFTNWTVSLDAELVTGFFENVKIHRGFMNGTLEVYESLEFQKAIKTKHLVDRSGNTKPLKNILIGHSMGGAVALLLAKKMQMEGHEIEEILTFSQPMVTDSKGIKVMNDLPLLRVGIDRDIVVYLPTTEIGYIHSGKKLEIDSYGFRFFEDSSRDNIPWTSPDSRLPLTPDNEISKNRKPYFGADIISDTVSEFMAAHSLDVYAYQLIGHIKQLSQ